MRSIRSLLTGMVTALLLLPVSLQAAVPKLIGYQGKLTNSSGQPVTGNYDFKFRLFNLPAGGSALWSEEQLNIEVANGLYSVLLGSGTLIDGSSALGTLPFNAQYWLVVEVEGEVLSPRQPLSAAPFAIAATTLDNASWTELTSGGATSLHYHTSGVVADSAGSLAGGNKNEIPYQTGNSNTGFIANSNAYDGYLLQSNGGNGGTAPAWVYPSTGIITAGTWTIARGGTGATTAANARTALDVQQHNAYLDDLADGSLSGDRIGSGVSAANIASGSLGVGVIASAIADGSYQGIAVGTATITKTLSTGSYENIRAGTATVATTLSTNASGSYQNIQVGTATIAKTLSAGPYENIRAGTATIALTLSTNANGTYPNMTVGTATSANALAAGSYENIRAGTATIALTLSTNANGTYPNMTVGTATSANALAAGSYENIRAGTATLALSITTTTISIGSYVNLPGLTTVYDSTAACQGLGFAEIDFAGVKQIIFSVYGYKGYDNPNNDLIWELYRDDGTPGSLMTASDTANTAGTRYVQSVLTSGIPTGAARVRIRARYQNSDADAAFLGASLKLVR